MLLLGAPFQRFFKDVQLAPRGVRCVCESGELTHEALQVMGGGSSSMRDYYDLTMNPLLLQLAIAAASLFILIVIVTFCCCIEIRR